MLLCVTARSPVGRTQAPSFKAASSFKAAFFDRGGAPSIKAARKNETFLGSTCERALDRPWLAAS
jgi:hypothetical protein